MNKSLPPKKRWTLGYSLNVGEETAPVAFVEDPGVDEIIDDTAVLAPTKQISEEVRTITATSVIEPPTENVDTIQAEDLVGAWYVQMVDEFIGTIECTINDAEKKGRAVFRDDMTGQHLKYKMIVDPDTSFMSTKSYVLLDTEFSKNAKYWQPEKIKYGDIAWRCQIVPTFDEDLNEYIAVASSSDPDFDGELVWTKRAKNAKKHPNAPRKKRRVH